jgi:hypothetical protein
VSIPWFCHESTLFWHFSWQHWPCFVQFYTYSNAGADPGWKVTVAVIHAKLGGSGGMPPRKIFEIWSPETPFPAFWAAYFLLKFEPKGPNFRWKNNEKQTKTTKHFSNNYDTSFSTPLVQHQNTIISLTSRRAPFTVFINNQLRRTPLQCTVAAEPRLTRGSRGMLPQKNLKPGNTISCNLSDVFPTQISVLNMHERWSMAITSMVITSMATICFWWLWY